MRHGDKVKNLSRTKSHRKALLKNLTISLFTHKAIVTTLAKAKALRVYAEPLITKTKGITTQEQMTARQRFIFSHLQHEPSTKELFTVIAPKVADRPGGYCRIIKLGRRKTDAAEMAYIELVDFNKIKAEQATTAPEMGVEPKAKRTRRGGAKPSATTTVVVDTPESKPDLLPLEAERASAEETKGEATTSSEPTAGETTAPTA